MFNSLQKHPTFTTFWYPTLQRWVILPSWWVSIVPFLCAAAALDIPHHHHYFRPVEVSLKNTNGVLRLNRGSINFSGLLNTYQHEFRRDEEVFKSPRLIAVAGEATMGAASAFIRGDMFSIFCRKPVVSSAIIARLPVTGRSHNS